MIGNFVALIIVDKLCEGLLRCGQKHAADSMQRDPRVPRKGYNNDILLKPLLPD